MFLTLSATINTPILIGIAVGVLLIVALIVLLAVKASKKKKAKTEQPMVEAVSEKVNELEEQPTPEKIEKVEEPAKVEEIVVTEADDENESDADDKDSAKRIPFAKKMLTLGDNVLEYYDEIHNKFRSMRKINPRISVKGVSYRLGRELVAKLTIRGKTLRLHMALDIEKFDQKVYFQKSMGDVKAYEEVPFTVKVRSERGLKNAIKLINALAEAKGIENKSRYNQIDSKAELKEAMVKGALEEN